MPARNLSPAWVLMGLLAAGPGAEAHAQSQGHDTSGTIGVLSLSGSFEPPDTIRFLNEDGSEWYHFTFEYDDTDGQWDFPNPDFAPLAFHPDYDVLALSVVAVSDVGLQVRVNEASGLTKWIPDTPLDQVSTWADHVRSVFSVGFDQGQNPIRRSPAEDADEIPFPGDSEFYLPVEARGDWLRISWGVFDDELKYGWIKWVEGAQLLVSLFYVS